MQRGRSKRFPIHVLLLTLLVVAGCARNSGEAPRPLLLPALADKQDQLDRIQLRGAGDKLVIDLQRQNGQWTLAQRGHWLADAGRISQYLFVLSQARMAEAKTDDPRLYARLGVEPVTRANATGTELRLHGGAAWPALVIGHEHAKFDSNYVRFANQKQAWLTDLPVSFDADVTEWLDRRLLDIPLARVASVRVRNQDGQSFSLHSRDDRFRLDDVPSAAMHDSHAGDSLAAALEHLRLDDVAVDDSDAGGAPWQRELQFTTVDGQVFTLQAWHVGARLWVRVGRTVDQQIAGQWAARASAQGAAIANRTGADYEILALRFKGRRFLLPDAVASTLMLSHDQILSGAASQ